MVSRKRVAKSLVPVNPEVERFAKFGSPQLIYGEDRADYDALLASICAAVKPTDFVEDMLVNDIAYLQWEILRLRRLKTSHMKIVSVNSLTRPIQCAPTARITSGGRFDPESCRLIW
jgi:hypothetical protein